MPWCVFGAVSSNLGTAGAAGAISNGVCPAWKVKRGGPPALIRWVEAGQWLALGIGQTSLPAVSEAARRIKAGARPIAFASNDWLEGELNLPRLVETLGLSPASKWPRAKLNVTGQAEN